MINEFDHFRPRLSKREQTGEETWQSDLGITIVYASLHSIDFVLAMVLLASWNKIINFVI